MKNTKPTTNAAPAMQGAKYKSVSFAYPSSQNAHDFGFASKGCYVFEVIRESRTSKTRILNADQPCFVTDGLAGFATEAEAVAAANEQSALPWAPWALKFHPEYASPNTDCIYLSPTGEQIRCTLAQAEAYCDKYGVQLSNVLSAEEFKGLSDFLFVAYHYADGQLYRTFHERPDGFALSVQEEARKLFDGLTAEEVRYASAPARGEYRGFAALHDLCDANMLLPMAEELPIESEAVLAFHNAVMDEVSRLIKCAS